MFSKFSVGAIARLPPVMLPRFSNFTNCLAHPEIISVLVDIHWWWANVSSIIRMKLRNFTTAWSFGQSFWNFWVLFVQNSYELYLHLPRGAWIALQIISKISSTWCRERYHKRTRRGVGGAAPHGLENFQGKRKLLKILNVKSIFNTVKNFRATVFSGKAQVAQKSWTVKNFSIQCIFTWGHLWNLD